ncbi:protein dml1 [Acrodontium crateriforme]|uniref:Protein dml1 n=1 Tax=Acrodontium crateriforme TaxID=150365 RepID=A0AAQ3M9B1_9PEZI|nr:protein dml1 [Acrodontium crateriforme]
MHEIVTLQFGQQANYVGTHYWNTQESYFTYSGEDESPVDHDVSFRAGIGGDGQDTYTPRTLVYDIKGAFGTLRRENALYELQHQDDPTTQHAGSGWSSAAVPFRLPPIEQNSYQRALDEGAQPPVLSPETVRFWSDYNHLFYHPRSIVQLNEYDLNSSLMPFEKFSTGEDLFASLDREHGLLDRDLRPFLEECDQLQGLQILTGLDDAWGGFATKYLERIADDMGKGCRWVFGLQDGQRVARERMMLQLANSAQAVHAINASASLHIPLTSLPAELPSYLNLDPSSKWHTSALQTAVMETITLPARLCNSETGHATFNDLEMPLSNDGKRCIAAASLSLNDPANLEKENENTPHDSRMTNGNTNGFHANKFSQLDMALLPTFSIPSSRSGKPHAFSTISSIRGPWKLPSSPSTPSRYESHFGSHATSLLFPTLSSFPTIFQFSQPEPKKLAIQASLSTSTIVAERIRGLEAAARRLTAVDEREALVDGLATMAEEYEEGWSDGSEDEEDE